jgi:mannan endo-1,4-beta-mannosidase
MKAYGKLPFINTFLIVLIFIAGACNTETGTQQAPFVKVDGLHFKIGNEKYLYTGVNFWHAAYLGANIIEGGQERLVRELDLMKQNGITNLRVMAASEASDLKMSVSPCFMETPGEVNEELLKGLDFLLNELGKRDMKAVMVLNNYWQWSGGMAQYVNWQSGEPIIDPDQTGDWYGFMSQSATFYGNSQANHIFKEYIRKVVTRTNSITQVPYSQDPAIMSWQLANEPRPHPHSLEDSQLAGQYIQWVDHISGFIRELDSNHLISTGNEGLAGSLEDSSMYLKAHSLANIDYLTFHIWPKNWGWYKAGQAEETFPIALENTRHYFNKHIGFANLLNKPTVLEEFGIGRDGESFDTLAGANYRDRYLQAVFSLIENNASMGGPAAGTNVWTWGGEGRAHNSAALWEKDVDFTGDPPQEPQGLNSIFDRDTSTLSVFRKHYQILTQY